MISIALDVSEDYLINTKFRAIVEEELFEWRKSRLKSFKILKKQMIPPKEKIWKKLNGTLVISVDEGKELYDDDIIDVENVSDELYDVFDNIDIGMEINATEAIEVARADLVEKTEDITPIDGFRDSVLVRKIQDCY